MKKLIALLAAVSIMGTMAFNAVAVSADTALTGTNDGKSITFDCDKSIVLYGFENGLLKFSSLCKPEDGKITVNDDISNYDLRACYIDDQSIVDVNIKPMATTEPVVTPTAEPEPTEKPATPTPTPAPTDPNEFPAVYEKAVDAVEAFSVVESVAEEMYESTKGYKLTYYFQGKQCSDWIGDDITIVSAPDSTEGLVDQNVNVLRRGDVVYLNRRMNGTIKNVAVIYQAQKKDIVNNQTDFGASFQKLFSVKNTAVAGYSGWSVLNYGQKPASKGTQYAFGVIARRENTALYLLNKTGDVNNSLLLAMADNAMVYECDMSQTRGITATRPLSIISTIPNVTWNKAMDNDGIINLTDKGYNYALARIVNGIVTDIVVYTNY